MMCNDQPDKKLYGCFRGIVMKHLSNGECKIWIPSVYPDEWSTEENADKLPSAQQATSLAFGANNGNGVFSYPNIGAVVWCFFERGDQNFPVYFASTLGGSAAAEQWDTAFAMRGFAPDDAYVHHVQLKNTHVYMCETGFLKVVTHDSSADNGCTFTMDADGNITLESSNTIAISAKNIIINGSSQINVTSPYIDQIADVHERIKSKAIELDSSDGHTTIKSSALYSEKTPTTTTFQCKQNMAVQEATEQQKKQAESSLADCQNSLKQQASQFAAEQAVKAKQAIDGAAQLVAQLPEKAIGELNTAISKLLNIINGYVSTVSDKFNADEVIAQLEALLNPVVNALTSLPIPEIPGLKQIKQLLVALKALNASMSSSDGSGKITKPKAEIPPELKTAIKDLMKAIQSLCMVLPTVLINLIFQMLGCIIDMFADIAGILGIPSIPFPLNLVPKCLTMMPDIFDFVLNVPGKLFDAMYDVLKRAYGRITELQFPQMPDKIEKPALSVPCPQRGGTVQPVNEATTIKWNSSLQDSGAKKQVY